MQRATTIAEVRHAVSASRALGKKIGCVPTMGALHSGHLSLIETAVQESDFVVVTIFVNPTQFAPHEDFSQYPRPLEKDLKLCEQAGANFVFHPQTESLYRKTPQVRVAVGELATQWEGASREGHFDGVATIVTKLFNIVSPDIAFFGQKDFQQLAIIKSLCADFDLPIEIVGCPTIREKDGLALSSRNAYLSDSERTDATALFRALNLAEECVRAGVLSLSEIREQMKDVLLSELNVIPEYATIVDPVSLQQLEKVQQKMVAIIAAKVGKTRLIDNCEINL